MGIPVVEINVNLAGLGSVKVDGRELPGVTGINVKVRPNKVTQVYLEMIAEVKVHADAEVHSNG